MIVASVSVLVKTLINIRLVVLFRLFSQKNQLRLHFVGSSSFGIRWFFNSEVGPI